jgi:hypothetical protein
MPNAKKEKHQMDHRRKVKYKELDGYFFFTLRYNIYSKQNLKLGSDSIDKSKIVTYLSDVLMNVGF